MKTRRAGKVVGGAAAGRPVSLAELNALDLKSFCDRVGPVFENSPWIAERAGARRPFASAQALLRALHQAVLEAPADDRIALIRAHPDLAGPAARAGALGPESGREQAGAGLNRLSPAGIERFEKLNRRYRRKFGFPFVICARRNKAEAILAGFEQRLGNGRAAEIRTALEEIFKIAELRLGDLLAPPARLTTHVLDTVRGRPARHLLIELWSLRGTRRQRLKRVRTNADGRTDEPLLEGDGLSPGEYELVFHVGDYFAAAGATASEVRFLNRVPLRFGVARGGGSYHVPLLCSPWAYSTYRGS